MRCLARPASAAKPPASSAGLPVPSEEEFDRLVRGETKAPLSRKHFRIYLQEKLCAENLEFLVAALDFRAKVQHGTTGDAVAAAASIADQFFTSGREGEINVSSGTSRLVLRRVAHLTGRETPESSLRSGGAPDDSFAPEALFEPAEVEISRVLFQDQFPAFWQEATQHNLSQAEVWRRYRLAVALFAASWILTLVLWLGVHAYIAVRLVTVVPNFAGARYLMTARMRLCTFLAKKNRRMSFRRGARWWQALTDEAVDTDDSQRDDLQGVAVADTRIACHLQARVKTLSRRGLALGAAMSVLTCGLGFWEYI